MIKDNCTFNPEVDKSAVEILAVEDYSINHMLVSGAVSGKAESEPTQFYNNIPVEKIAGRVNDQFASLEINKYYRKNGTAKNE